MSAIARWCFRHRFAVIAAWVLVLVGLGTLSQAVKSDYNNSFSLPGTGSTTAQQLLSQGHPGPGRRLRHDRLAGQPRHGARCDGHHTDERCLGADRDDARGRRRGQPVRAARGRADQPGRPHRVRHGQLRQAGQQPGQGGHHPGHRRRQGGPCARAQRPARRPGHRADRADVAGRQLDGRRARGRGGAVHRVRLAAGDAAADSHRHRRGRRRADGDRAADPRDERRRLRADPRRADRPGRGHRLRPVHRHQAPSRPAVGAHPRGRRRSRPSTPPVARCCSRAARCASPCSAYWSWASAS